jgi:endo-1,4-beta-xylanase
VVSPDHVEFQPNPAAVAYKKEIMRDPASWQWNLPLALPQVTHGVIRSESMKRDVGYNIYLPPGYAADTATCYPVVYYCHGATGSLTSDIPVVNWVSSQIEKRQIGKVIYVFMNAGNPLIPLPTLFMTLRCGTPK